MRLKCLAGNVAILLETGDDKCVHPCVRDDECGAAVCEGDGFISNNGKVGSFTEFCINKPGAAISAGREQ